MQDSTLWVKSVEGQKHAASLLEAHLGIPSHVLIHFGSTSGQGAGTTGVSGTAGLVLTGPALVGLEITLEDEHAVVVETVCVEVTVE